MTRKRDLSGTRFFTPQYAPSDKVPRVFWWLLLIGVGFVLVFKISLDVRYSQETVRHKAVLEAIENRQQELRGIMRRARAEDWRRPRIEKELGVVLQKMPPVSLDYVEYVYEDNAAETSLHWYFFPDGSRKRSSVRTSSPSVPLPQRLEMEKTISRIGDWLCPVVGRTFVPAVYLVWLPLVVWGAVVYKHERGANGWRLRWLWELAVYGCVMRLII